MACIVVLPEAIAETGTEIVVAPAGMVTPSGTVATNGLLELNAMVKPPIGAGADKLSWSRPWRESETDKAAGENVRSAVTVTHCVTSTEPFLAVTFVDPKPIPDIRGMRRSGVVDPGGMKSES